MIHAAVCNAGKAAQHPLRPPVVSLRQVSELTAPQCRWDRTRGPAGSPAAAPSLPPGTGLAVPPEPAPNPGTHGPPTPHPPMQRRSCRRAGGTLSRRASMAPPASSPLREQSSAESEGSRQKTPRVHQQTLPFKVRKAKLLHFPAPEVPPHKILYKYAKC